MSFEPSSPSAISTNMSDFISLVEKSHGDTSLGRGWGTYKGSCPLCYKPCIVVAPIGAVGFKCQCGYTEDIHWCDEDLCDGIWLDPVAIPDESIITPN